MNNPIEFPPLEKSSRDREYSKVSAHLRDKVLYLYLFEGYSHRRLDSDILKEDCKYSRGYVSMGILHHMGIVKKHKAIFKGMDIKHALLCLKGESDSIRKSLMRYNENVDSKYDIEFFCIDNESTFLQKQLDISQLKYGVRIDKDYHEIFNPSNSQYHVKRGARRKIKILFNDKVFDGYYCYENQNDKSVCLQRISFLKPLKEEFKKVYPSEFGEFSIYMGQDVNHFVFKNNKYTIGMEDAFDWNVKEEYEEGDGILREHFVRERNHKLVKNAKMNFKKNKGRLYCEVCGFDFNIVYGDRGDDYIEGHHMIWLSEVFEQRKTKIEDIAMLCANCHRMIHRNPKITVEELKQCVTVTKNNHTT